MRRYITEKEVNLCTSSTLSDSVRIYPFLTSLHYDGPLILNCRNPQYKIVKYNEFTLKVGTFADSCCGLNCGAIVCIKNVAYCTRRNIPIIIYKFLEKEDLFTVPCASSMLGIYSVHLRSDLRTAIKKYS